MDNSTNLLDQARQQVSFDVDSVTPLLYGSKEQADHIKEFLEKCKTIPEIQTNPDYYNLNRGVQFLSKGDQALAFQRLLDFRLDEIPLYLGTILYSATTNYYGVYFGMVVPAIKVLGTEEQIKKWYKDCLSLKIAGCYAQTELAHGSDVQSLQTTATYDQSKDEFIIHTPNIDAVKFWPGELGFLANWALVYARLIVNGKSHGVQAFMVPIRDLDTHKPLPGIEVGDIGPKIGYSNKDNGYLRFTHVRIPSFNMLAKYVKVTPDGQVIRQGDPKVSYSAMMIMRKLIITVYPRTAATSLTIAIRYSIARQQFTNDQGKENSVIEYQTQQHKLLPLLSNLYAVIFTSIKVGQLVDLNFNQVQSGNFTLMAICHAIICGTKANFTYFVANCAEWCRLSCGGHGYAHYSGLPAIYQDNCPNITLEGENQIMYLQLARFLLKLYNQSINKKEKVFPTYFGLFNKVQAILQYKFSSFDRGQFLNMLEANVILQVQHTSNKMMAEINNGVDPKSVWDYKIGTDLWHSANNFIEYYKYVSFLETIQQTDNERTRIILREVADLFAASILLEGSSVLIESGAISVETIKHLRQFYTQQLTIIKPEAIGLVEAFRYNDAALRSTIGCSDGQPYEKTYNWALNENSLNKKDFSVVVNTVKNIRAKL